MKSFKQGASSLRIKNQVQRDQYANNSLIITVPNYLPDRPKNIGTYDEQLIIALVRKNFYANNNYIQFLPRSSSKVLGDSYFINRTPFNKQYRYDYKFLVGLGGLD